MEEIGKEVHRSLQMEPARFWVREDVYYKALKCEMKQIAEELQRLSNAGEISEELHETIRIVGAVYNGMKEDIENE